MFSMRLRALSINVDRSAFYEDLFITLDEFVDPDGCVGIIILRDTEIDWYCNEYFEHSTEAIV